MDICKPSFICETKLFHIGHAKRGFYKNNMQL